MERRLLFTLTLLGLLLIAHKPAFAQAPDDDDFEVEMYFTDDMDSDEAEFEVDEEMIFAGGMGHGMGIGMFGHGCGLAGMADELELSKDQRKQLEDLRFNFRKGMIPMRAQLQVLKLDLQRLIHNDAKRADIDYQIDLIAKHRGQIQKETVAHRMAMKAILTPEQKEKLTDGPCMMGKGKGGPMKDVMIKKLKNRGGRGKGL